MTKAAIYNYGFWSKTHRAITMRDTTTTTRTLIAYIESQKLSALVFIVALFSWIYRIFRRSSPRVPPGPPSDSLIGGNKIPDCYAYRYFESLTKVYGPVFSLRHGLTTIVVVGRFQAAVDIMEREGVNTAGRPPAIAAGDTLSGGMRVMFQPFGDKFKKIRKALHAYLHPKAVQGYEQLLMKTARLHILDIIREPARHQAHAKRHVMYAASITMSVAYGKPPNTSQTDDPDVVAVSRCLGRLGLALRPGVWKVDFFPWLKYVPGYLKELQDGHAEESELFIRHLREVKTKMDRGDSIPPSFSKYLLERQAELGLDEAETAYLAGSIFGAGSDTTASAISVTILAAILYPEEQRKVQDELDRIVGRERPPTFGDEKDLVYLQAFVLESYRWRPVTAGGFAHQATKDIVWKDYIIPKGATVIGNVWSVGRDPDYFPEPEEFRPSRWLNEKGTIREDLKNYAFGFGRRVCPGQHLAHASVFVNAALLHWAFKMSADEKHPADPLGFTESANAHPRPFKVEFESRITKNMDGIAETLEGYGL